MARILITGASGLLGANLLMAARAHQHDVIGFYNQHPITFSGTNTVSIDLTDPKAVQRVVTQHTPDWIVHCAAYTSVDWCEDHETEAWRLHVDASRTLAETACENKARLIYISTDAVYGSEHGNHSEDAETKPVNAYARTKLAGEQAIQTVMPEALIVRTTIYGWNFQPKHSLAEWILSELEAGRSINGFDDVLLSPILVNDLSEALLIAMDRDLKGLYNIGGSEACSKYVFAVHLAEVFGLDSALIRCSRIRDVSFRAPRPYNTSMNMDKINRILNTLPNVITGLHRFKELRDSGYVTALRRGR